MVLPFLPNPIVPQISSYLACRARGGKYRFRDGFWVCDVQENEEEPTDPPETDDDGNDNPPQTDEDREDTDDDTVQPIPPPIPIPPLPPIRNPNPRDNPDREPIPIPVGDVLDILPKIPRRRLPSLERPENDDALLVFQDPVIGVEEDAFTRTYGCLLHNPITSSPVVFRRCESQQDENPEFSPVEDAQKFFEYLIRKTAQTGVQEGLIAGCVLTLNLLPTRIIRYAPGGQLAFVFGCNLLTNIASDFLFSSSNAHQSIDGNGHINVKYVECTPEGDEVPDLTKGLESNFNDINECFVPIRNFRKNEPEQLGMKRQLQVIYQKTIEETDNQGNTTSRKIEKQITIPNPVSTSSNDPTAETLDTEAIKNVFPERLEFGDIKVEMDIIPYGYVRFYSTADNLEGGNFRSSPTDQFFDDILTLIDGEEVTETIEGEEVRTTRRYSRRRRNIITGEFTRKKAFLFEWTSGDGKPPLCQTFNLAD